MGERTSPKDEGEAKSETLRELRRLPRGDREVLRLSLDRFKGFEYVSVRVWYQPEPGAPWLPTRKGVTIKLHELPDVIQALASEAR